MTIEEHLCVVTGYLFEKKTLLSDGRTQECICFNGDMFFKVSTYKTKLGSAIGMM